MSEPNQNSVPGCLSLFDTVTACGSTVPSHGARIATRIMSSSTTPPTMAVGWRRSASRKLRQVGETGFGVSSVAVAISSEGASVTDAWVEEHVAQVHRQVDEHVGGGEHQHHALDDRVVAPQDSVHSEPADTGKREHGLGHDG